VPVQPYNNFYRISSGYIDAHTKGIFNRKPLAAMITGTNGTTSFGHTSSLVYTKKSLDNKYPYLTFESLKCGNYEVTVSDDIQSNPTVQESGKLASVRIITDEHDIPQLPPFRNYRVVRKNGFVFGTQRDTFKLEVVNPALDAYAAVYIQDLAGNDTTYVFTYKAGSTILGISKATNSKVPVGVRSFWTIHIFPKGDTTSASILVESIHFKDGQHFELTSTTPTLPHIFSVGDTLLVSVCTYMSDTAFTFTDSLTCFADWLECYFFVMSKGATGLLSATDK